MWKYIIITLLVALPWQNVTAQTCCSGGIPIAGNIAFENNRKNTWQLGMVSDFNILNTLKDGSVVLESNLRNRKIYSLMLRGGYNITDNLVAGSVIPFVRQERWINTQYATNYEYTQGMGDLILFAQYLLPFSNLKNSYQVGVGSKLSTGAADIENPRGIAYNMDMQPGSGSIDALFFGAYDRRFKVIPSMSFSSRIFYRLNGKYKNYLDGESFQFGNEWQIIAGLGKQWLFWSQIFNTSVMLKVRNMNKNRINGFSVSNTGGTWINLITSLKLEPSQKLSISLIPEIPVYSELNGTQLTTSYRIRAALTVHFKDFQSSF